MPSYIGGKSRICKDIYKVIKDTCPEDIKEFYDLFCGGLSVSLEFVKNGYNVYSNDYNEDLIFLWNHVRINEIEFPIVSKEDYQGFLKSSEKSFEKSFALFYCSYMCKYKGSYINDEYMRDGKSIHHHKERFNSIKKEIDNIRKIKEITCLDYKSFSHLEHKIIYLDPPYVNTSKVYKSSFNTEEFWDFVSKLSKNNYVFVSEQECPIEHEVVFEKDIFNNLKKSGGKLKEKLFFIT